MDKKIEYWKWKSTIIDFNAISDEPIDYDNYSKKKDWVFRYLGIPDNDIHEWYSGGYSSEYNIALKYAKELGLVEDYVNYDDIIFSLKEQQKEFIEWLENKIIEHKNLFFGEEEQNECLSITREAFKLALLNYKKIIGVKDENNVL